jgi:glucose-6-phosphate 1-epimerase
MTVEESETEILLTYPSDSTTSVRILKYGATILSWKIKGKEQLWLSEKAILDGSKAVRGGIPLVFPVFGKCEDRNHPTNALPQHGFARNHSWEFLGQVNSDPLTVQFGLGPENLSDSAKAQWPYDFTLIYTVSLASPNSVITGLSVENTDKKPFDFNVLFHTYFRIPDVVHVNVKGLEGLKVVDKVTKNNYVEAAGTIVIGQEVDRVYSNLNPNSVVAIDHGTHSLFTIEERKNLNDVVVWNPWIEKAEGLGDFYPKGGYKNMICVETGSVSSWVKISPSERWESSQTIKAHL